MCGESDWHSAKQAELRMQVETSTVLNVRKYADATQVCEQIKQVLAPCVFN